MIRGLALAAALVIAACGGGGTASPSPATPVANKQPEAPPPAPPPLSEAEAALASLERFEKAMCACPEKDEACAKRVSDEMNTWSRDTAKHNEGKSLEMTGEQGDRAAKLGMQIGECMQKALAD